MSHLIILLTMEDIEQLRAENERLRSVNMQLIRMIANVRRLQKGYFKTRSQSILSQSKEAERQLDAYLRTAFDHMTEPELFPEENDLAHSLS